jgi:hypothetical protein
MGRIAGHVPAGSVTLPLRFKRKHQHRELGLSVGLPGRVYPCSLQIVEINERASVGQATDVDVAGIAYPPQQGHQPGRETKVVQMVCSKMHLQAVHRGLSAGECHYACTVDKEIERLTGLHPPREISDRSDAG